MLIDGKATWLYLYLGMFPIFRRRRIKTLLIFQRDAQQTNNYLESETLLEALDTFARPKDESEVKSILEERILEWERAERLQSARSPMRPHYTKILRSDCLGIKKKN
jgi:hypothetical protein